MSFVEDGRGSGRLAAVSITNRMAVEALGLTLQHYTSHTEQSAYQVSNVIDIAASKQPILLIENGSVDKDIIVTYIRIQSAGASDTNENAFFTLETDGQWASGGTDLVPVNLYTGSSNAAVGTFKGGVGITTSGITTEIDRNYQANSMQAYNKEGSLIIPRSQSLIIYHTGSSVAGKAYARVSFLVHKEN